jgi:hypothetical protein
MSSRSSDQALTDALRALAEAEALVETPPQVEEAIMALWDAQRDQAHTSRSRRRTRVVRSAAAMAAGVTIVGSVVLQRELADTPIAPPRPPVIEFDRTTSDRSARAISDAIAAQSARATEQPRRVANDARSTLMIIGDPIETGEIVHIVRMRVKRSALTELGIAANVSTEMVYVDVLVAEDGVARGVRVSL